MQFFAIFLIFKTLVFFKLSLVDASESNITALETEGEFSSCTILKTKYEILTLRLEITEKFGFYVPDIDKKLKYLDDKIHDLYTKLNSRRELDQSYHKYSIMEGRDDTPTSSASIEDAETIPPGKIVMINNDNSVAPMKHDNVYITNFNDDDEPKVCRTSENGIPVCSKIELPSSCDNNNGLTCGNNKCRIRVMNVPSFMVSCYENWIVIQRRLNGSVDFNRNWLSYKNGFGDLDGEFWLGLDKIHALTKALAPVELLIHMKDFNDVESFARYESFSIGDESDNYRLAAPGAYTGTAGNSLHLHRDEAFTTFDNDNDKNSAENCAQALSGGWWYYDCEHGKEENSNLNGQYFSEELSTNIPRHNGIKWSTCRGGNSSLKFVQMMIKQY